jgi:hypothetical protein
MNRLCTIFHRLHEGSPMKIKPLILAMTIGLGLILATPARA